MLLLAAASMDQVSAQSPVPTPLTKSAASSAATVTAGATPATATATVSPTPAVPTTKEDLVALAQAAGNFKTFLKAIDAAGLTSTLQKPGPYTVFAPTDTAFSKLPAGTLDELLKPENKAKLVATLSYHIAPGKYSNADLVKMDEVRTLQGTEVDVDTSTDGKIIEIDEAKILGADVDAANGVLHAIDSVLQP
jgi:uncharacterized surface protein with fasciclin (FAS1) repeats